ncbi:MAG: cytochrome c [Cyanobacteria bacterium]|nr:cytochrome c [Cyanobacteriota bacterium]
MSPSPSIPSKGSRTVSKNQSFAFNALALGGFVLLGSVFLSGCVVDKQVTGETDKVLAQPVVDVKLASDDFGFPSAKPTLSRGKVVFEQNCAQCHTPDFWQDKKVQTTLSFTTPIDYYLMLSRGTAPAVAHPTDERHQMMPGEHLGPKGEKLVFKNLSRDDRWAVLFYTRYLAGLGEMAIANQEGKALNIASDVYGGNCAVCHGNTGNAEGFLHTGKPSKHGPEGGKVHMGLFQPPPANLNEYQRMYNRTDAQLNKYISQGIYPSAMPRWYGRQDKDKKYVYNNEMLWKIVRYVRTFTYKNDLPDTDVKPVGPMITLDQTQWYHPQTSLDIPVAETGEHVFLPPSRSGEAASNELKSENTIQVGEAP